MDFCNSSAATWYTQIEKTAKMECFGFARPTRTTPQVEFRTPTKLGVRALGSLTTPQPSTCWVGPKVIPFNAIYCTMNQSSWEFWEWDHGHLYFWKLHLSVMQSVYIFFGWHVTMQPVTLLTSSGSGQSRMVIVRKHFGLHPKRMHQNRSKISHNVTPYNTYTIKGNVWQRRQI